VLARNKSNRSGTHKRRLTKACVRIRLSCSLASRDVAVASSAVQFPSIDLLNAASLPACLPACATPRVVVHATTCRLLYWPNSVSRSTRFSRFYPPDFCAPAYVPCPRACLNLTKLYVDSSNVS